MNEKLRILKMLENGQISATEAASLLQAVEGGGTASSSPPPFAPPPAHAPYTPPPAPLPPPPAASTGRYDGYATNNPGSGSPSGIDDLSRKFESFAKDMAPKAQRFMESLADKIDGAASRVSGAFTSDPHGPGGPTAAYDHGQSHRPASKPFAPSGGVVEKNIEMAVETGGYNELSLNGLNGEVRVKGYNGDKITARLVYRAKKTGSSIEMVKLGGKYFLKYEPDDFHLVTIDAFVPERAFSVIKVDGVNSSLDCASLAASEMRFVNANGSTRLAGLSANNIHAESSGGSFNISNISATGAKIENLNGPMDAGELDIANLKISNYNSPLSMMMSKFARHSEYIWSVETGNAKLNINLPTMPDLGYHIKAHAAMSEIRLGLTGLQFLINEPSLVEARSVHFDSAAKRIKMAVETSNAPLVIN
ncbi:MAG: DUF4097 domain-containing protein [Defluviitaleaceae bacterium]|nr:DUF4097 domain-containing protein [Defluviitaleaceae bacterium]